MLKSSKTALIIDLGSTDSGESARTTILQDMLKKMHYRVRVVNNGSPDTLLGLAVADLVLITAVGNLDQLTSIVDLPSMPYILCAHRAEAEMHGLTPDSVKKALPQAGVYVYDSPNSTDLQKIISETVNAAVGLLSTVNFGWIPC